MEFDDIVELDHFPSFLVIGAQRSGKTEWVKRFIAHNHEYYDRIDVISGSIRDSKELGEYLPEDDDICVRYFAFMNCVDGSYVNKGPDIIKMIIDQQRHFVDEKGINYRRLLIFDDWIPYIRPKDPNLLTLASQSRHLKLSVVYITQQLKTQVPTCVRGNCHCWVVFRNLSDLELEGVTEYLPAGDYQRYKSNFKNDYHEMLRDPFSFCFLDRVNGRVIFAKPLKRNDFLIRQYRKFGLRERTDIVLRG